jgi:hypothetical protein
MVILEGAACEVVSESASTHGFLVGLSLSLSLSLSTQPAGLFHGHVNGWRQEDALHADSMALLGPSYQTQARHSTAPQLPKYGHSRPLHPCYQHAAMAHHCAVK